MKTMYYIGLDVHKRMISYCVKDGSGAIHAEGTIPATRFHLGSLDENTAAAADRSDGSHRFYRLDLRSLAPTCSSTEGSASVDAACHCEYLRTLVRF
jgi:hypothetical protein